MLIRPINVERTPPHTHWHRVIIIYRGIDRYRQGCKNKTEGSVLSCLKRMPDDFTSTIETYIYSVSLSHVAEQTINIHFRCFSSFNCPTTISLYFTFEILPCPSASSMMTTIHSRQKLERRGRERGREGRQGRKEIFGDALEEGKGGSVRSSSDLSARFSLFRLTWNVCKIEE